MAYSNWGAFVYCNGERRKDKEDVGVFEYHAVLGDGEIRLCGYKCYPKLLRLIDGKADEIDLSQFQCGDTTSYRGVIDGHVFEAYQNEDDNMLGLNLIEPDGKEWTSTCGFEYGAGHMD